MQKQQKGGIFCKYMDNISVWIFLKIWKDALQIGNRVIFESGLGASVGEGAQSGRNFSLIRNVIF